jgi:hypothetical protein
VGVARGRDSERTDGASALRGLGVYVGVEALSSRVGGVYDRGAGERLIEGVLGAMARGVGTLRLGGEKLRGTEVYDRDGRADCDEKDRDGAENDRDGIEKDLEPPNDRPPEKPPMEREGLKLRPEPPIDPRDMDRLAASASGAAASARAMAATQPS